MSGLLWSAPTKPLPADIANAAAAPERKKSLLFIVLIPYVRVDSTDNHFKFRVYQSASLASTVKVTHSPSRRKGTGLFSTEIPSI